MYKLLRYFILVLQICAVISAQQIDKVIISGLGGQHDIEVKNAFLIGYSSYNGAEFTGDIFLYTNSLQASLNYATANDYDLIIRSTTGLSYGISLAPSYPTVKLVMPAGSNSYVKAFSGDVINSPVVITGAGIDSNQTGYELEFFSIDPITSSNLSSFANGYVAGQLAFIANILNCSVDSARTLARSEGTEKGTWDMHNGFGKIQTENIITDPLPVELTSFIAKVAGDKIYLNWQTATEVNNYGFEIERLKDYKISGLQNWETIGFVEGSGNSNSPEQYSFTDYSVASYGKNSYRLKQIDNDGKFEYSKIIEVNFNLPALVELKQNYPNPFNPSTTISLTMPESENVSLKIYNTVGEEVATLINGHIEAGEHSFDFKAGVLPSGMYVYQLKTNQSTVTKKMLLLK